MTSASNRLATSWLALLVAPAALLAACGDEIHNDYHHYYYGDAGAAGGEPDGSAGEAGGGGGGGEAGSGTGEAGAGGAEPGVDPRYPEAPRADTEVAEHELELFGVEGNRFYFAVSDAQRQAMNDAGPGGGGPWGPHYTPGGSSANYVDHLWVTTAGPEPKTADYGKVQVKVVGQSTRQPWDSTHIPNLNVDIDEFVKNQRIGGYEHLRFSNGQVGTIYRDRLAYDIYRALDYPAPLVRYVWVDSNVWGPSVSIPYILVERYKRAFCNRNADELGGGCTNMWELVGDFGGGFGGPKREGGPDFVPGPIPEPGGGMWDNPDNCQLDTCEGSRVSKLEEKLLELPPGEGFKEALSDYIDWPAFHRFQCLSWLLATSDDTIHASNNVVLVERADGLFQYLPYSVDISLGFGDSGSVGLRGNSVLARGCQDDPACWSDTLDACEAVLDQLEAIDPRGMLLELRESLKAEGMLRSGDDFAYRQIDDYLAERLASAPAALQQYREGSLCEAPQVDCNGFCQPPPCFDGEEPKPEPKPEIMSYAVE